MSRHRLLAKSTIQDGIFFFLSYLARLGTFSMIIGSHSAFFSYVSCITPLSGTFLSSNSMGIFWIGLLAMRIAIYGLNPFIVMVHWLPGLCAARYWREKHWIYVVVLPLLCMLLFAVHPVGQQAIVYSFFWIIPIFLYYVLPNSLFAHCLSSTFIAHGVGSVIWLYGKPAMIASTWIALIPVVCVERLGMAVGMMLTYTCITFVMVFLRTRYKTHAHA
jgi:hypothetical protein